LFAGKLPIDDLYQVLCVVVKTKILFVLEKWSKIELEKNYHQGIQVGDFYPNGNIG